VFGKSVTVIGMVVTVIDMAVTVVDMVATLTSQQDPTMQEFAGSLCACSWLAG